MSVVGAVLAVSAALLAGFAPPASAAASRGLPAVTVARPHVTLSPVPYRPVPSRDQTAHRKFTATETRVPVAWSGSIPVAAPRGSAPAAGAKATTAGPAWAQAVAPAHGAYRGPRHVGVTVEPKAAAQKLGIRGVVWRVSGLTAGTGAVRAGLDYRAFAQAYGGNFGQRLTLVELPACALTTPQLARCRKETPVAAANNAKAATVSAVLPLPQASSAPASSRAVTGPAAQPAVMLGGAVVLAATTTAGGEGSAAGTYGATSLQPSESWSAGGSTGSFTYSYPITLPDASSLLAPKVSLDYDSGSVDGQTAATQAQANWAGDGWSTGDSYVEQTFTSCADSPEGVTLPTADQTEDMCYDGNILTLSLNGQTTALVYDSPSKAWRLQGDDGATVAKVTTGTGTGLSAEPGVTSTDTSYWKITERDGTSYYFGYNELPGWASGDKVTSSVDYEPVYSANSGDPCYSASGFTSSVCTMPYRWHLDYVTDRQGDAMSYYYAQATNYYGQDQGSSVVPYVRDSYLTEVDYGFRVGSAYSATAIPDKVVLGTGVRCFASSCPAITSSNSGTAASAYPDVPYDLNCAQGSSCTIYGPTFWSTARLTTITTQQYTGSAFSTVDLYTLNEAEPATGDGTSPTLWLSSVSREGEDTTAGGSTSPITLPSVSFGGQDLANRVDTTNFPGLFRYRIDSITSEMGAVTGITYGTPYTCSASYVDSMTTNAQAAGNTDSCYPVWWTPAGYSAPVMDWFEKYAVTEVTVADTTGGERTEQTSYQYTGGAAWHYDDNEVVKAKYRTYGQFRGYGTVTTLTGDGVNDLQAEQATTYYRGMSDDNNTTAVTLTDSQGGIHDDTDQLAGQRLETTTYNGAGGPVDHSTITSYWISPATATRTRTGLPDLTANMVESAETFTRQALTDGGTTIWRYTETDTTYHAVTSDAYFGLPLYVYEHTVAMNTAYDRCTATTYAPVNASENLVGLVASTETDSVACSGFTEGSKPSAPSGLNTLGAPSSVTRPDQVVLAAETFYDDQTSFSTTFPQTAAPTTGNVTMTRKASGYASGAFTWQTTARDTYDSYGRVLDAYDGNGNETVTAYTVNGAGLTTAETATNPLSQSTSKTLDPERGLTLTSTDANGVVTTEQYDALGRLTSVWLDSRAPASVEANYTYAYTVSATSASGVIGKTMGEQGGYATTVTILDSLGRTRETQADTPQAGRLITDDFYDSRGWTWKKVNRFWDPNNTPALGAPVSPSDGQVPDEDKYTFNGLGQVVQDSSYQSGSPVSTTTTVYNGDRTTVIPSAGGTVKSTATDPLGRTIEADEYTVTPTLHTPSNTFTGIWYVSGGTTAATTYGYDGHGNQSTITDQGSHTWTTTYNLLGQATSKAVPDSGTTSGMTYDGDGNLTQETSADGAANGTVSYTYDPLGRKTAEYAAASTGQVAYVSPSSPGNEIASWAYDNSNKNVTNMKYPIGHLTTQTTYSGGQAFTIQQTGFNIFGDPTGDKYTIPTTTAFTDTGLPGTYTFTHQWTTGVGLPYGQYYPAAGGLPSETTSETYLATPLDLAKGLGGTITGYAQTTTYDQWGDVLSEEIGTGTNLAGINSTYDTHTLRLTDQVVQRSVATPATVDEEKYAYDLYGNITSQASARLGSSTVTETQCYQYDGLDQLTQAWTSGDNCTTTPTSTSHSDVSDGISSASAYWTTWAYDTTTSGNAASDVLGEMTSQLQHSLTGGTDTTTTGTFGGSNGGPHALTTAATTGGSTSTSTFKYDAAGNMTTRAVPATGTQTLTWNAAGQLTKVSGGTAGTTSYVYAPNGTLLMQADPAGTTVYLDGEQITAATSGSTTTLNSARIIPLPSGGDVVRTGTATITSGVTTNGTSTYYFEIPDPHGTNDLYLDSTAQTPTWRQFTPYGAPRGTPSTWIDNRGFLNQPTDTATGLTYDGARAYDPATGQFTSPDPVLVPTDPQDLNPYGYGYGNPVDNSDPTGQHGIGNNCNVDDCNASNDNGQSTTSTTSPTCGCGSSPSGDGSGQGTANKGDRPDPSDNTPVPSRSQISYMRHSLGYTGPDNPTSQQIDDWLKNTYQKDAAWDFYCQGLLGLSVGSCRSNPNSGNSDIYSNSLSFTDYEYVGLSGCVVLCAGITYQDSSVSVSFGGLGLGGFGKVIGVNSYKATDSAPWTAGACVAPVVAGACGQVTKVSSGDLKWGGGLAVGEGGFAGLMVNVLNINWSGGESYFLGLTWHMGASS